eukprot:COSAG05_NODE_215_length_13904_cov_87.085911_10_plen_1303_part_00
MASENARTLWYASAKPTASVAENRVAANGDNWRGKNTVYIGNPQERIDPYNENHQSRGGKVNADEEKLKEHITDKETHSSSGGEERVDEEQESGKRTKGEGNVSLLKSSRKRGGEKRHTGKKDRHGDWRTGVGGRSTREEAEPTSNSGSAPTDSGGERIRGGGGTTEATALSFTNQLFFDYTHVTENIATTHRALQATQVGTVTTLAGQTDPGVKDATGRDARFEDPHSVAVDPTGKYALVVGHASHLIRRLDLETKAVTTLAGQGREPGFKDATGRDARFERPMDAAIDPTGKYALVADSGNNRIRRLDLGTKAVTTLAGQRKKGFKDATGTDAQFRHPHGVAIDPTGKYALLTEGDNHGIRLLDLGTKAVTTLAGQQKEGFKDATGRDAQFERPHSVAIDPTGKYALVPDSGNNCIRLLDLETKAVTTLAGQRKYGFKDATGTDAQFAGPMGIAIDPTGKYALVAEGKNCAIRLLDLGTKAVTTLAGQQKEGFKDATGRDAQFRHPHSVAIDPTGKYALVADSGNNRIRKIIVPPACKCENCTPKKDSECTSNGASMCKACNLGFQPNSNKTRCIECAQGKFMPNGSTECKDCAVGDYNDETGQTMCKPCVGGVANRTGSKACTPCSAGRFIPKPGREADYSCKVCTRGKGPIANRTACEECPGNSYSSCDGICRECTRPYVRLDAANCVLQNTGCAAGSGPRNSSNSSNSSNETSCSEVTQCQLCPPGSVSSDGSECTRCTSKGEVANQAQVACQGCSPGTEPATNRSKCIACVGTNYSDLGVQCKECDSKNRLDENRTKCWPCTAGKEVAPNRTACTDCPAGKYSTVGQCETCKDGKIADVAGSTSCGSCPRENMSPTPDRTGCVCAKKFYSFTNLSTCQPCSALKSDTNLPLPAKDAINEWENFCEGGPQRLATICPLEGVWIHYDNRTGLLLLPCEDTDPDHVQCQPLPNCKNNTGKDQVNCSGSNGTALNACCADHHTGHLCAFCEKGYAKVAGKCVQCGAFSVAMLCYQILFTVLLSLFMMFKSLKVFSRAEQTERMFRAADEDGNGNLDESEVKALLTTMGHAFPPRQLMLEMTGKDDARRVSLEQFQGWCAANQPNATLSLLILFVQTSTMINAVRELEVFNLNIPKATNTCVGPELPLVAELLLVVAQPLSAALLVTLIYCARSQFESVIDMHGHHYRRALVNVLQFAYAPVTRVCAEILFTCHTNALEQQLLATDMRIECWKDEHLLAAVFAGILFAVLGVGLPLYLIASLSQQFTKLLNDPSGAWDASRRSHAAPKARRSTASVHWDTV